MEKTRERPSRPQGMGRAEYVVRVLAWKLRLTPWMPVANHFTSGGANFERWPPR